MQGSRVGVIGGGQLAWMMGAEAPRLNLKLMVQTPSSQDPAVSRAQKVVLADVDDAVGTKKLAQVCDVVTFENEFIDLDDLRALAEQGVCFRPSLNALAPLLDKFDQRNFLHALGAPVPRFSLWSSQDDIVKDFSFPLVLKARRHGYDGQGTFIIKDLLELEQLAKQVPLEELLVEEFIPFERELGIIAARNVAGQVAIFPVTETYQKNQICHWTISPAPITPEVAEQVRAIARQILEKLEVVGVFGIEFFLTADHQALVNEIAPRTHNSGHYTLGGCETSQFAMQLQAVTGMPLGSTALKSAGALMVNLLGFEASNSDYQGKREKILQIPNAFVHWYGKASRPGRKLGHATVVLNSEAYVQAKSIISKIESFWYE